MPNFLDNLGLGFFYETEETTVNFIGYLAKNGKAINGYYDCPMLFTPLGDIDCFVKTKKSEDGRLEVCGIDTHCCGLNIWKMRNTGIDITPEGSLKTERVNVFCNSEDATGILPIHLINADVLPSFLEDDIVEMQMCAFPLDVNYYADEEDYAEHQPEDKDGKQWLLADGSLIPLNFLANHALNEEGEEKDCSTDDHVFFRGTVKGLYPGVFKMDDLKEYTYIRCVIETNNGELHFAHTLDQIEPEQRDNLKVGSVVAGVCVLSGDVAVGEYADGIVRDLENNLRLLKQVMLNGEAERMRAVLTEDAIYISESSGTTVEGVDAIIERFDYVNAENKDEIFVATATITQIDSEEVEYPVGTRCVLISYNVENGYDAIAFIDVTEAGNIKRIYISRDSRYHFIAD